VVVSVGQYREGPRNWSRWPKGCYKSPTLVRAKGEPFVKSHFDRHIDAVVLDAKMVSYTPAKQ